MENLWKTMETYGKLMENHGNYENMIKISEMLYHHLEYGKYEHIIELLSWKHCSDCLASFWGLL